MKKYTHLFIFFVNLLYIDAFIEKKKEYYKFLARRANIT